MPSGYYSNDLVMTEESALEFPCQFPIKVMGMESAGLQEIAIQIVESHTGKLAESAVRLRPSSKGKFVSVTITVTAESQQQLDAIYQSLTAHEAVLFAL
jgi:putative lipoic acid-binding regulatory protein